MKVCAKKTKIKKASSFQSFRRKLYKKHYEHETRTII